MSIVSSILPPWAIVPLPKYMRDEFSRRQKFGKNYSVTPGEYVGPRFTWIRCLSNAIVQYESAYPREGFIFKSGGGFKDNYGINDERQNIIGYDAYGDPHYIDNRSAIVPYRPVPGIIGIDVTVEKSIYRKATIRWKCNSVDQLEYMGKYFFSIYNTVVLEWGWSNFDEKSLLPIFEKGTLAERSGKEITKRGTGIKGVFSDPNIIEESILKSNGNYDSMIGHIVKWDYKFDPSDSSFNCSTEIASNSRIYLGLSLLNLTGKPTEEDKSPESVKEYFRSKFKQEIKASVTKEPSTPASGGGGGGKGGGYYVPPQSGKPATYKLATGRDISTHGKVFVLKKYIETVPNGDIQNQPDLVYITFGLLCEILNDILIPKIGNSNRLSTIDISRAVIGGHVNMISTDKDLYLIPNKVAPYFNMSDLCGDYDASVLKDINSLYSELPLKKQKDATIKQILSGSIPNADELMARVFNARKARQDLSEILIFDTGDSKENLRENIFPKLTSEDSHPLGLYGYIKDIFINVDAIVKIIDGGAVDIGSILKLLCDKLTACNPWWKLAVQPSPTDGYNITIIDENYSNFRHMNTIKTTESMKLAPKDSPFYFFDAYNSNSVMKEFTFDVRISDAVASSVVNQINSDLSKGGGLENTSNHTSFFTGKTGVEPPFDRIIDGEVKFEKIKKNHIRTSDAVERFNKINQIVSGLDDDCLTISDMSTTIVKKKLDDAAKKADSMFSGDLLDGGLTKEDYKRKILADPELAKEVSTNGRNVARLSLPKRYSHLNLRLTADKNVNFTNHNNIPIPGAEIQFTVEGMGGFKTFQVFGIKDLPEPYKGKVFFKIKEVKHTVSTGGWNTMIVAAIIPIKNMDAML